MTWLAWRSQRLQLLVCVAAVALVAAELAWSGTALHSAALAQHHFCSNNGTSFRCAQAVARVTDVSRWVFNDRIALLVLPGVLGLVLGAPLVAREIEQGTNRLAWTQSIGRTRWLVIKLLLAGLLIAAVVGAIDPLLEWWNTAVQNDPRIDPGSFSVTGFVDVGYALFAFMLGTALGSIIRRTGWAVAAGVPLFVGFRYWVMELRPHFAPVAVTSLGSAFAQVGGGTQGLLQVSFSNLQARSWFIANGFVPDGRTSPGPGQNWNTGLDSVDRCLGASSNPSSAAVRRCAEQLKLHWIVQYQPASHFWALQTVETAVFVGAALVLCGITVVSVQRWRT
jgi:hypothetical protein